MLSWDLLMHAASVTMAVHNVATECTALPLPYTSMSTSSCQSSQTARGRHLSHLVCLMLAVRLSINALYGLTPDDMMQVPCHGPQGWTSTQMACQSQSKRMMTRTSRRLCRSAPLPLAFVDVASCVVARLQTLETASGQVLAQRLQGPSWIVSQLNSGGTLSLSRSGRKMQPLHVHVHRAFRVMTSTL